MPEEVAATLQFTGGSQSERTRPTKTFSLDPGDIKIVSTYAVRHDIPMSRAVSRIVREWYELKFGKRH